MMEPEVAHKERTPSPPAIREDQEDSAEGAALTTTAAARELDNDKRVPPPVSPYKTHARLASQVEDDEQESASRKREREGSLEPTGVTGARGGATASLSASGIPFKKNKLVEEDEQDSLRTDSQISNASAKEGEKVGQIRQRVQDLTWQERKRQEESLSGGDVKDDDMSVSAPSSQAPEDTAASVEVAASADVPAKTPERAQPTFSSFSSKPSPFAAAAAAASSGSSPFGTPKASADQQGNASPFQPTKLSSTDTASMASPFVPTKIGSSDYVSSHSEGTASPQPTTAQPTFSSYSSSSSPFASSSSAAGPSWLASGGGASAGSGSSTGMKPSSLGSSLDRGAHHGASPSRSPPVDTGADSSGTPPTRAPSATSAGKAKAPSLGFGAFAGAAKFGGGSNGAASPSRLGTQSPGPEEGVAEKKESCDFAEALAQNDEGKEANADDEEQTEGVPTSLTGGAGKGKGKSTVQETDVVTGEESERTVYSARAKLYVMGSNDAWKERGTGTIRCNVPKKSLIAPPSGGAARLVMRADGVLRVILNVPLFAGMSLELAQDRFIRLVALEEGKLTHFTLKLSNAAAASAFLESVGREIPAQARKEVEA